MNKHKPGLSYPVIVHITAVICKDVVSPKHVWLMPTLSTTHSWKWVEWICIKYKRYTCQLLWHLVARFIDRLYINELYWKKCLACLICNSLATRYGRQKVDCKANYITTFIGSVPPYWSNVINSCTPLNVYCSKNLNG